MAKAVRKVSWRTLMRRAKDEQEAGKPKVAAALRAEAATLRGPRSKAKAPAKKPNAKATSRTKTARRSDVAKKGWATRRVNLASQYDPKKPLVIDEEAVKAMTAEDRANDPTGHSQRFSQAATVVPGHGEMVGGPEYALAEEICKMARRKGGKDDVQNLITMKIAQARGEGENAGQTIMRKLMVEQRQKLDSQIVCGFIAEVEDAMEKRNGLEPGGIWTLNSLTIVKIIDALNAAGYTRDGKRDERPEIVRPRT